MDVEVPSLIYDIIEKMKRIAVLALLLTAVSAFAEKQPLERYQSIIDRQMFGPLPPGFDPTKSPSEVSKSAAAESEKQLTQEQEKLQSSIRFSVINVTPEGKTAVGFTDNSDPKAPVHYYLKVGEKRNGWEVKEADAQAATMTIAKGEIEVSLSLGGNSAKDGGTAKAEGGGSSGAPRYAGGLLRRQGASGLLGGSLRDRRRMRQQLAQEEQAKAAAAAAEERAQRDAQAAEEKAQREAERAEQRQQLLAIQEELKRVREAKAAEAAKESSDGNAENNAE